MNKLALIYLDWLNNFLTIEKFAEDYGLDYEDAIVVIKLGKKYSERKAGL